VGVAAHHDAEACHLGHEIEIAQIVEHILARWACPICRPRRSLRVTVDCGSSISDGRGGCKEGGKDVARAYGGTDIGKGISCWAGARTSRATLPKEDRGEA
jgi:hypothetical protein